MSESFLSYHFVHCLSCVGWGCGYYESDSDEQEYSDWEEPPRTNVFEVLPKTEIKNGKLLSKERETLS